MCSSISSLFMPIFFNERASATYMTVEKGEDYEQPMPVHR
jgi:hypothetical protein